MSDASNLYEYPVHDGDDGCGHRHAGTRRDGLACTRCKCDVLLPDPLEADEL